MKPRTLLSIFGLVVVAMLAQGCAGGEPAKALTDDELGLDKESVFATPDPIVASSTAKDPGENELLGAYFSESPPSISHDISEFLPIKIDDNMCMDCHDLLDEIGNEQAGGDPTPMPTSHYTDLRSNPGEVTANVIGARFVCTQCHATQVDAEPLVENTYRQ